MTDAPAAGGRAPDFRLPSTEGDVALGELLAAGKRVVLAFHAEDGTPACETQLGLLRDAHEMVIELGGAVVAVSADTLEAHEARGQRHGALPFPLAADPALDAARAYGVVDSGDPRRAARAIFVIDRDGSILYANTHFQPGNPSQVEAIFTALGAG